MSKIMYMDDEYASGIVASFTGDLLVRERYTSDTLTIAAYGTGGQTIDITKDGYTAIGVVGLWARKNANSLYYNFRLGNSADGISNTVVTVGVKNHGNAAIDGQFSVDILYVKNLAVYANGSGDASWKNGSTTTSEPIKYRLYNGVCYMTAEYAGQLTIDNTVRTVMTLPEGYRPSTQIVAPVVNRAAPGDGVVYINTDGTVALRDASQATSYFDFYVAFPVG